MRYCVNVPNFGEYHDASTVADLAAEAEDAGWDGFFTWDHLQGYGPVGDATVTLAAVATRTSRMRIGAMVTPLSRRRPWKVAREMAALDHLSRGRVIMGVGLGNPPEEFSSFGEDPDAGARAERLDEGLDIVTALWSGEPVTYHGKHYTLEGVEFAPRPLQSPRIPIWVGGFWPSRPPMRRAARFDGVYPARNWPDALTAQDMRDILEYIAVRRASKGSFDAVAGGQTPGDPEAGAGIVEPWRLAGATWWSEDVHGWRGPLDEMRARVRAGPPRL